MIERDVVLATGLRYHLREWGKPSSKTPTTFLIHGFLDSSATWNAVCDGGLADGRHLVAPDMRGHGDSDRVGAGGYYHFADYLADLDALLEHFPDRPIHLVGHSMGGSICTYFAGSYPKRIAKLALLEGMGPPEPTNPAPERITKWIAAWRKTREASVRSYPSKGAAAARLQKHDPLLPDDLALSLAQDGTRELGDGSRAFKHDPVHASPGPYPFRLDVAEQFWSAIECPVLALEGSKSLFRHHGPEAEKRYAHLKTVERATIDGAGHMMQRHRPVEIAASLLAFL